jgi:hypothetical protein
VAVLFGDPVEASVINAQAKRSIRLFNKEDRGAVRRGAGLDKFFGEEIIQLLFEFVELGDGEADDRFERWVGSGVSFNTHGVAAIRRKAGGEGGRKHIRVLVVNDGVNGGRKSSGWRGGGRGRNVGWRVFRWVG